MRKVASHGARYKEGMAVEARGGVGWAVSARQTDPSATHPCFFSLFFSTFAAGGEGLGVCVVVVVVVCVGGGGGPYGIAHWFCCSQNQIWHNTPPFMRAWGRIKRGSQNRTGESGIERNILPLLTRHESLLFSCSREGAVRKEDALS